MSTRIYDAVVNKPEAWKRKWTPLQRQGNQALGWYPWGTIKKHLLDPSAWGEETTDKAMWTAITETTNYKGGYHSFMIKIIRKNYVLVKATPRNGIAGKGSGMGMETVYLHV
eukprot:12746978-Heterocapsa_arctica.AAC.2